jgi:single-strand DNA-binding protein
MPSVNRVILIGNLTRDPQSKQLATNTLVAEFGLALNRKFKGSDGEEREEVCFLDCAAFGRQAEVIQQYCKKGKLLYVEGRFRYDTWEDKNGGGSGRRSAWWWRTSSSSAGARMASGRTSRGVR